jgi:CheY-like chemotaxis protein
MHGLRILVAEDNLLEAEWLQQLLAEAGHEVIGPAARLGEALYLATHEQIDGALLDVDLAGVNSFAVAWCLRDRHVPFAFITGYPRSYFSGPRSLRSFRCMAKPLDEDELLQTVAAFAARLLSSISPGGRADPRPLAGLARVAYRRDLRPDRRTGEERQCDRYSISARFIT